MENLTDTLADYLPMQNPIGTLAAIAVVCLTSVLFAHLFWRRKRSIRRWVVVDGSNVMYWKTAKPQLDAVSDVVTALTNTGWSVVIVFDANAGYLVSDRYRHDSYFAKALGLPTGQVMVVPKGTPADPFILKAARLYQATVVTNDLYRDWTDEFPEVQKQGFLTPVKKKNGDLWLELNSENYGRAP